MEAKGEKGIGAKFVVCVVNMKASVYIHVTVGNGQATSAPNLSAV